MTNEDGFIKRYSRLRIIFLIVAGLISGSILHGVVFSVITISNFSDGDCLLLTDPHSIASRWYHSSAILILITSLAGIVLLIVKNWLRIFSAGILLSILIPSIVFFRVKDDFVNEAKYYKPFNEQYWKKSFYKPLPMARWMDKNNYLTGRSSSEIIEMLGNSPVRSGINDDSLYTYQLEMSEVRLEVTIQKDRVVSESVTCNFN
jgi:hypothetical protein